MPYLDQIVCGLNEIVKTDALSDISSVKDYGLSEIATGENKTRFPSFITYSGEIKPILIDDLNSVLIYHKCYGLAPFTKKGYGRNDVQGETASMSLMLFAFRNKVRKPINWFETVIKEAIPTVFTNDDSTQRSTIAFGNSSYDTVGLLAREWVGIELNYLDAIIGMDLTYTIKNTWQKGCISNCDKRIFTFHFEKQFE